MRKHFLFPYLPHRKGMENFPTYPETRPGLTLNCRGKLLSLAKPQVMGILNVTPDSFSDGGKYTEHDAALAHTEQMLEEGARIIDIGGYSSRPGAVDISLKEEIDRVQPIAELILARFPEVILSVDTFRSEVARPLLESGAHIINDISGGRADANMYATVAEFDAPYVMMHMQGSPQTMQKAPRYEDISEEIFQYFCERIPMARQAGIKDLILDPGFGFGKTLEHNYELFRNLHTFNMLELPMLVGLSRKSMIYKLFDTVPTDVLELSSSLHFKALEMGANILRVHDVQAAVRTIQLHGYLNHGVI